MWQKLPPPPNPYGGYKGINVGYKAINYPKSMARTFSERDWAYITIEFDEDTNQIRFTRCEPFQGYKLTRNHNITAKITHIIPLGRYMCFEENEEEILFIRYGD